MRSRREQEMKVFVYTKSNESKKIATITDVRNVVEYKESGVISFETKQGVFIQFDTKKVKTTIYQN